MSHPRSFRADIQGLRAIAVLLVVVFHVFPSVMSGGYVGVDVFFVISGFLICGLILKDAEKNGRFNVLSFYDRRIRRLLPAASVVLIVTAVLAYFILPQTRWVDTGREIIASTLYVENLYLHFQSIDYLTADKPPSPLQHFWSLSVEEQFYLLWPLIMLITVFVSSKIKLNLRKTVTVLLILIFIGSLTASIIKTANNPAGAYFVTYTRMWELAIGGLLACTLPFIRLPKYGQIVLSIAGLAMIMSSALLYTKLTPFPGYTALLPTVGVTFLLLAGARSATDEYGFIQKLLSLKPFTFIGDISYSLYLWHWPIVIFAGIVFGTNLSLSVGLGVIALSVVLSTVSKIWIEDPIRKTKSIKTKFESYLLGFGMMASTIIAGLLLILAASQSAPAPKIDEATFASDYPGALAINKTVQSPADGNPPFVPSLEKVRGDIATVYAHGCHTARPDITPTPCYYEPMKLSDGSTIMGRVDAFTDPKRKIVAMAGDSHTAHWLPTVKEIAIQNDLAIVSYTKSSCAYIGADLYVASTEYTQCGDWTNEVTQQLLTLEPSLLLTGMISNHRVVGAASNEDNQIRLSEGLASLWGELNDAGIRVAAIRETPRFEALVPDCVAIEMSNPNACSLPRSEAMRFAGAIEGAARLAKDTTFVDMTDYLCTAERCEVVVGNVLVYRDQHHITATYARSMADELGKIILPLIK